MPKAIKITEENRDRLERDYGLEEDELETSLGLYLVADFGSRAPGYGFLSEENLNASFTRTGAELENDYFEVTFKGER